MSTGIVILSAVFVILLIILKSFALQRRAKILPNAPEYPLVQPQVRRPSHPLGLAYRPTVLTTRMVAVSRKSKAHETMSKEQESFAIPEQ
jgi:hypothetical protein